MQTTSVDIERDAGAARHVVRVDGGNLTVPAMVLADGTALTSASTEAVLSRARA